jgi:hypothetical protein
MRATLDAIARGEEDERAVEEALTEEPLAVCIPTAARSREKLGDE